MVNECDARSDDCSIPIQQSWKTAKLLISWKYSLFQKQKHMVFLFLTWAGNGESIPFMHWREYAFNRVDFCFYFLQERSWFWMGLSWEMNMLIKAPFIHAAKAEIAIFMLWDTTPRYTCQKWITCGVSYFDLSLSKTAWWNCVMEVWWLWHLNMAHMEECQASDILKSSPCQTQKHMVFLFLTWARNGESIPFMHWRESMHSME